MFEKISKNNVQKIKNFINLNKESNQEEIIEINKNESNKEEPKNEEIADNNGENEANNGNSSDHNSSSNVPVKPSKPNIVFETS